ncbi:hypothetical protein HPB47_005042 [Ixodes persulcatus]|uniref:Uncharacterized protein n=1 Tax=Ixodes persulcatus TaxID=34615 RepID=A0AC60PE32_IXOPE|nr:hypothetical protein HPB47_005042 [Ixodes persulcatus]
MAGPTSHRDADPPLLSAALAFDARKTRKPGREHKDKANGGMPHTRWSGLGTQGRGTDRGKMERTRKLSSNRSKKRQADDGDETLSLPDAWARRQTGAEPGRPLPPSEEHASSSLLVYLILWHSRRPPCVLLH